MHFATLGARLGILLADSTSGNFTALSMSSCSSPPASSESKSSSEDPNSVPERKNEMSLIFPWFLFFDPYTERIPNPQAKNVESKLLTCTWSKHPFLHFHPWSLGHTNLETPCLISPSQELPPRGPCPVPSTLPRLSGEFALGRSGR